MLEVLLFIAMWILAIPGLIFHLIGKAFVLCHLRTIEVIFHLIGNFLYGIPHLLEEFGVIFFFPEYHILEGYPFPFSSFLE